MIRLLRPASVRTARWVLRGAMIALLVAVTSAGLRFAQQGGRLLTVQSGSMQPLLKRGDAVIITRVRASQLRIGDIVSYHSAGDASVIVSHRIVSIDTARAKMRTKGDALQTSDPVMPVTTIVGEARAVAPGLGSVLMWLRSPFGLALAVYAPATAVICWQCYGLIRVYRPHRYSLTRG